MVRVKELLQYDESFRARFPDLKPEIDEFLKDPSCPCHAGLYRKIISRVDGSWQPIKPSSVVEAYRFSVINCQVQELEKELRKLPVGSNVEGITRYENEITCVIRTKE